MIALTETYFKILHIFVAITIHRNCTYLRKSSVKLVILLLHDIIVIKSSEFVLFFH